MSIKFTLLGTGSSMGVPQPDGFFGLCDPKNKKNYRTRCSANKQTLSYLKKNFTYCFKKKYDYDPILSLRLLKKSFIIKEKNENIKIRSIPVKHGAIDSIAFILNDKLAYVSDANKFYNKDIKYFKNLQFLIIDCLRFTKHPSHFNLENVLEYVSFLKPKKTILTNLHSDLDYTNLLKILPNNIKPGYDGLSIKI